MPPPSSHQTMEREQLANIVRKLMIDADDFFVQQQKTLQLSYAELNSRIDQLRMRVQQQQQHHMHQATTMNSNNNNNVFSSVNPSPFSTVHSLPNADVLSMSGTGQGVLGGNAIPGSVNVNATPLRTTSGGSQGYGTMNSTANNGASRSLLSSLNGPSAMSALSEAALESGRLSAVASGGGFMGSATVNGTALTGGLRGYRVDAITPPNKQLALSQSTSKSPSMPQPQPHGGAAGAVAVNGTAVYDDPITGEYFSTAPNNNNPSSHHDSLMASPQASQKLSLEELIERFNMSTASVNAAATAFNFDSLYEQLTSGGPEETSQSPLDYTDNVAEHERFAPHQVSSRDCASGSGVGAEHDESSPDTNVYGGSTAKNSIPVDSLRAVHDQHLTTSVRVVYEQGRPKVVKIPGGAADTPESLGINPRSSCEVLVEFKRKRVLQYESNEYVAPGSYVIVGGDRGEDLGLVVYVWCEVATDGGSKSASSSSAAVGASSEHGLSSAGKRKVVGVGLTDSKLPRSMGVGNGTVLRLASEVDVQQLLGTQAELERRAIDVCAQLVLDHSLPMVIVDAEYQFDKKKLTFFYEAQQRMDFRELVRHLYKTFRARIWMELVDA
ncbi:PSP1 C-terminal conserved region containing protein [Lotmaria passim]